MDGYDMPLSGFESRRGCASYSEGLNGVSQRNMPSKNFSMSRPRKESATRTMHKEKGHMLDFMVDHSHNGYSTSNQPNPKIPFSMGELVSSVSGPRLPGQGCQQHTQEIISAMCLDDRTIVLRITILAAGFVIGPRGSSIKLISEHCNVDIESKTVQGGDIREFKCKGNREDVVKAVQIIKEAVNTYKILTEGDYKGQCVQSTMVILGVTFDYCPPPKSKMPHAASVIKLSPNLVSRKEDQSSLCTMDSSSSVDSTQSLEPFAYPDGKYAKKYRSPIRCTLSQDFSVYPEDKHSNLLESNRMMTPWRTESLDAYPSRRTCFADELSKETNQPPLATNSGRMYSAFISPCRDSQLADVSHRGGSTDWVSHKAQSHRNDDCHAMRNLMKEYGNMDV